MIARTLLLSLLLLTPLLAQDEGPKPQGPEKPTPAGQEGPEGPAKPGQDPEAPRQPEGPKAQQQPEEPARPQAPKKPVRPPPPEPPQVRGMGLTMHSKDPTYDYGQLLRELPEHGVTHVCVMVHFFQPTGRSLAPARHPLKTPSDRAIIRVLKTIRSLNMEVALLPIVLLETPADDEWRGNLSPPDRRGRDRGQEGYEGPNWDPWFRGYEQEIVHFARLAQTGGATLFSVGSELSSTEKEGDRWKQVVRKVRKVFSGQLTYSANWDHYGVPRIWAELDCIGLSGYYELTPEKNLDPSQEDLDQAWRKVRDRILRWRKKRGLERKPIVFTELGYPSIDGGAWHPWDYTRKEKEAKLDHNEQRMAYQAFANAWRGRSELLGVYFYEWWGYGGKTDRSYSPRHKPAMGVIRSFFGVKD